MLSGEVHYWRVAERHWPAILDAARALGLDTVGTYVPWQHHEGPDGRVDLAELLRFLDRLEERGLRVFLRPGPYVTAEWRNLGLPDRVAQLPRHDPRFRREAARWLDAVLDAVRPRLGRSVVALQADNEIDPMPHVHGEDQGFAAWLAARYGSVERLNAAWSSAYSSFDEPLPTLHPFADDARWRDGARYRYDLASEYARWIVGELRRRAPGVPVVLNTWPYVNAQHWGELAALCDVFGIDPYPDDVCRAGIGELCEQLRLLRAVSPFPFVAELGLGVWHGADPRYEPAHYELCAFAALAAGVRGWNWYMLANRDNWTGAALNERGVARPELQAVLARAVEAFRALEGAPPPEAPFGVLWSWEHHQRAATLRRPSDDPLFAALRELGVEHDLVPLERLAADPAAPSEGAPGTRAAAGSDALGSFAAAVARAREDRARREVPRVLLFAGEVDDPAPLWRHVDSGGTLVCFQRLPPGLPRPDGTSHHAPRALEVSLGFRTDLPVFAWRAVPGEPIEALQRPWGADADQELLERCAVGRRYTTGYVERRGAGTLAVVGCAPSREALLAVLRHLGVRLPAVPRTAGIHVARRGARLVVLNPGEARTAAIEVEDRLLHVELARCSGRLVELAAP